MGMYHATNQQNSRLQEQLTHQLDTHLSQPKKPRTAAEHAIGSTVSFRWAFFVVFTFGGCIAILLAILERQNTAAITPSIEARTLAILGIASIFIGICSLFAKRQRKSQHHA